MTENLNDPNNLIEALAADAVRFYRHVVRAALLEELADAVETPSGSLHHMTPGELASELRRRAATESKKAL